ncbi:MAG: SDR family oxidoreductase [Bacteroidetes bacterium]|nr:SDR family oxidoreductase [Bacteroidota bacterium]
MDIRSKTAIVTGAGSGLGAAISEALIREEVSAVYGLARTTSDLLSIQKKLGEHFIPVTLDITDRDKVVSWIQQTFSQNVFPDILINNAGVGSFGRIDEMAPEDWYTMVNTNLNGLYHITSEAVKLMRKKKGSSHIINIGSILGTTSQAEGAAYSATKFGMNGFSEALFKELRGDNIKVTCLNPGSIETGFFKTSGIKPHENMLQPNEVADTLIHVLKTPDNVLINELTIRPLNPKAPV